MNKPKILFVNHAEKEMIDVLKETAREAYRQGWEDARTAAIRSVMEIKIEESQ